MSVKTAFTQEDLKRGFYWGEKRSETPNSWLSVAAGTSGAMWVNPDREDPANLPNYKPLNGIELSQSEKEDIISGILRGVSVINSGNLVLIRSHLIERFDNDKEYWRTAPEQFLKDRVEIFKASKEYSLTEADLRKKTTTFIIERGFAIITVGDDKYQAYCHDGKWWY